MKIHRDTKQDKYKKFGFGFITCSDKIYITKDNSITKWSKGFSCINAAINFMEGHNYVVASVDEIDWSQEDLDYLLDTYHFKQEAPDIWVTKINDVKLTLNTDLDAKSLVLNIDDNGYVTIKEFSSVDKAIQVVDRYFNGDDIIESVSMLTDAEFKQVVTAARSSRDIAKNLVRVRSSNLWAYGMDIKNRKDKTGTLVVQFKGRNGGPGDIYVYFDVPTRLWQQFINATSKGHFFWMNIRNNFWYRKLTGDKRAKLKNGLN